MAGTSGREKEFIQTMTVSDALDISVVICTYTEERWDDLVAAIESVQCQTVSPIEIIVVVDHNISLLERVRTHIRGVIALENQGMQGAAGARNSGVAASKGKIIAFLDDDAVAFPDWLEQHYSGYERADVLGVGGEIEPLWLTTRPTWFPDEFNWVIGATYKGLPETTAPVRNLWTVNMSVRRDIFDEIQGFRTGFGKVGKISSPEDTDFCIRAIQCRPQEIWLFRPNAKVRHKVPASRANWKFYLWRCFNEGFGKAELSGLVGVKQGMSAERNHMLYTLPTGVAKGLVDALFRRDSSGFGRAVAILFGMAAAITGYCAGIISGLLPRQIVGET
jgi:glycosyltransferase involved in cell wall biosynthesis